MSFFKPVVITMKDFAFSKRFLILILLVYFLSLRLWPRGKLDEQSKTREHGLEVPCTIFLDVKKAKGNEPQ